MNLKNKKYKNIDTKNDDSKNNQCKATTKTGNQCKRNKKVGELCWQHHKLMKKKSEKESKDWSKYPMADSKDKTDHPVTSGARQPASLVGAEQSSATSSAGENSSKADKIDTKNDDSNNDLCKATTTTGKPCSFEKKFGDNCARHHNLLLKKESKDWSNYPLADSKDKTDGSVGAEQSSAGEDSSKVDKNDDYETKRKEKQLTYFREGMLHEELIEDNKHLIQGGKRFGGVFKDSGGTGWMVTGQTKRFGKTIKIPSKYFSFKKCGSKENAKEAAYAYRDKISDELGLTKNRWWRDPKNSKRCFGIVFSPFKGRKWRATFTFPYAMINTFKKYTWRTSWDKCNFYIKGSRQYKRKKDSEVTSPSIIRKRKPRHSAFET